VVRLAQLIVAVDARAGLLPLRAGGGAAGQAVDEGVEENLEALVGVGEGELVGEAGHGREEPGGERSDVVAGHVHGLLAGGQITGRGTAVRGRPASTPVSSTVKPFTVAMRSRYPCTARRGGRPPAQDGQHAFGELQRVRADGDAADRDPHYVVEAQADPALIPAHVLELILPS
jgi:hypothetical protein